MLADFVVKLAAGDQVHHSVLSIRLSRSRNLPSGGSRPAARDASQSLTAVSDQARTLLET